MSERPARRDFDHGAVMRRGRIVLVVALIAGAVRIYMTWPRRPDLRAFDSAQSPAKAAIAD
jgi:hypothetical protein